MKELLLLNQAVVSVSFMHGFLNVANNVWFLYETLFVFFLIP